MSLTPPTLGRRSRVRPRLPRPPRRPARAGLAAAALRPGHADRGRSVRPHPTPVGVLRRRRARGRPGRHHPEAPPHRGRRRGQRPAVDAVHRPQPATPRTRPMPRPEPETSRSRSPPPIGRRHGARPRGRQPAHAHRHQPPVQRPARRPDPDPDRRRRRWPARCGGSSASSRDTDAAHSPLWTRRSLAPPAGDAAGAARRDQGGRQEAGRHPEHGVHHRVGGGGRRLPPRGRARPSTAAGVDGHQHPDQGVGLQRLLTRPAAGADRRDGHGGAVRG